MSSPPRLPQSNTHLANGQNVQQTNAINYIVLEKKNKQMEQCLDSVRILVEGSDPPPFGLITLGALSPCLFTLQQPLGHEGVNKASRSSAASIKAPARELRSLLGSCKSVSSIRVNGPQHWILQYRSQRDRQNATLQDGPNYFIVLQKVHFYISYNTLTISEEQN